MNNKIEASAIKAVGKEQNGDVIKKNKWGFIVKNNTNNITINIASSNNNEVKGKVIGDLSKILSDDEIINREIDNEILKNDAPINSKNNIKEIVLESTINNEHEKIEERVNILGDISTTNKIKKSSKEEIIKVLIKLIKDKDGWKEDLYKEVWDIFSRINNKISERELLEIIEIIDYCNKNELDLIIDLLSLTQISSLVLENKIFFLSDDANYWENFTLNNIPHLKNIYQDSGNERIDKLFNSNIDDLNNKFNFINTGRYNTKFNIQNPFMKEQSIIAKKSFLIFNEIPRFNEKFISVLNHLIEKKTIAFIDHNEYKFYTL